MKYLISLILCLIVLPSVAANKESIDFYARYECSKDKIIVGDSTIVNIVLYSSHPFQKAECATKSIKLKGGKWRQLPRREERQQQKVRTEKGIYYAIIWQRFMVGSEQVEQIKFPELQFEGQFVIYDSEPQYDPFDPFGFFGRPQRKSHLEKSRCKCDAFVFPIVARPKRSTQEIISSGGRLI